MAPEQMREIIQRHATMVRSYIDRIIEHLRVRGVEHDASKMIGMELEWYARYQERMQAEEYGSPEYVKTMREMQPAIDHHFENNRHHPEHHENGIDDMTLVDIVEMFCDWKAASHRGDRPLSATLPYNKKKHKVSDQLFKIFQNTDALFEAEEEFEKIYPRKGIDTDI